MHVCTLEKMELSLYFLITRPISCRNGLYKEVFSLPQKWHPLLLLSLSDFPSESRLEAIYFLPSSTGNVDFVEIKRREIKQKKESLDFFRNRVPQYHLLAYIHKKVIHFPMSGSDMIKPSFPRSLLYKYFLCDK